MCVQINYLKHIPYVYQKTKKVKPQYVNDLFISECEEKKVCDWKCSRYTLLL